MQYLSVLMNMLIYFVLILIKTGGYPDNKTGGWIYDTNILILWKDIPVYKFTA